MVARRHRIASLWTSDFLWRNDEHMNQTVDQPFDLTQGNIPRIGSIVSWFLFARWRSVWYEAVAAELIDPDGREVIGRKKADRDSCLGFDARPLPRVTRKRRSAKRALDR